MRLYLVPIIAAGILLCLPFTGYSQKFDDDEEVKIGFILDGDNAVLQGLQESIKNETTTLLESKYKLLVFPEDKTIVSDFTDTSITTGINKLFTDPDVDILIGIGTITSINLANRGALPKPTIAIGIINPQFQEVAITEKQTSGVGNFTYVTLPFSPRRDLEVFRSIIPFENLGIVFSKNMLNSTHRGKPARHYFDNIVKDLGFNYQVIPISNDSLSYDKSIPDSLDAIFTGLFFDFSIGQVASLYQTINEKGIPSFALGGEEYVKLGAMASFSSEDIKQKVGRRTALNIEKILDGKNPENIPVLLNFRQSLILNQRTMDQIDVYPNWEILSEAELLFEDEPEGTEVLSFMGVIQEALESNMDLKVAALQVKADSKEVDFARSNLLPQIDIGATATLIDKYRASSSLGQNPEQSAYGSVSISQLVFSDKTFANLKIQKHIYESIEFGYQSTKMDIILDVSTLYLNILQAISMETIARENLKASRKNLEIARMRESVGYSGASDVYRWESKISSDKIDLLSTNETRKLAEFALQEMLNRPFDQKFVTEAVDIMDSTIFIMGDANISKYIDNSKMKDLFRDFLVREALTNLPELKQLEATIAAQERYLKATKRTRYLPDVGISAQANYDFYRGGAGSTMEPIEIQVDPDSPPVILDVFEEPEDFSWNVGLNATLPVSQGGRLNYDMQQAEIDLLRLQEDRYNISRKLTRQVVSLFEKASLSYPKIELSANAAEYALKSYDIVQDSYSHGVVSITQLLDAQQAAVEANLYASISVYAYLIDVLNLQRAMGRFFILIPYDERGGFFYRLDEYISNQ